MRENQSAARDAECRTGYFCTLSNGKGSCIDNVRDSQQTPPFSYMDIPKHRERIERVFTADNALKYVEFAIKAVTNSLPFEEVPKYADAVMLQRYTAVCGHLAYSLEEYQKAMLDFAEQSDGNEADRTAEGFAKMFGTYFPPEFSITEGNAWMSTLNNSVQYISVIRPGEKLRSWSSGCTMYPL